MSLQDLHKIQTTKSSWHDFVEYSIRTPFYTETKAKTQSLVEAIQLTLFHDYLSTFSEEEVKKFLSSPEAFHVSAESFVNILEGVRYSQEGYNERERAMFLGMLKSLLRENKPDPNEGVEELERYHFYRCIIRFCSDLDYILRVYEKYKTYISQGSGV
ncbi:hypothetical protein EHQ53_02995 [Leptospira langatensis]|uniref:Uncharacterized protein n=1 Tax=Leptospira langatensis TaxID=2484983 RepID=A0A5F1ZXF5_9LEPT|nr:hypothetical protein [Leptospira langatensis]TGK04131.1 hypothetical protein EHO57_03225 [Leptospira langatensis]TGL43611.1 hypothetical protein EHQ53_02995 [Leptospira langatensis]